MLPLSGSTPLLQNALVVLMVDQKPMWVTLKMHLRSHFVVKKRVAVKNHDSLLKYGATINVPVNLVISL